MHNLKCRWPEFPVCFSSRLSCLGTVCEGLDLSGQVASFRDSNTGGLPLTMPEVIETHILSGSLQSLEGWTGAVHCMSGHSQVQKTFQSQDKASG